MYVVVGEHDPIGDLAHLPRCSRSSSPAVTTAGVDDTVCCYAEKTVPTSCCL